MHPKYLLDAVVKPPQVVPLAGVAGEHDVAVPQLAPVSLGVVPLQLGVGGGWGLVSAWRVTPTKIAAITTTKTQRTS